MPARDRRQHRIGCSLAAPRRTAERTIREERKAIGEAIVDHAAQEMVIVPDTQFHLDGIDLGDSPGVLNLADRDVAQTDGGDEAIALELFERANTRGQRSSWMGCMKLLEMLTLGDESAR